MERVSFLGFTPSLEVRKATAIAAKADQKLFRGVLSLVVTYITGGPEPTLEQVQGVIAKTGTSMGTEEVAALFSGCFLILRSALRAGTQSDHFAADLNEVKFPPPLIQDLDLVLRKVRAELDSTPEGKAAALSIKYPSFQEVKWRVDVAISTSAMSRVMAPVVLMETKLSDGKSYTFEVSHDKFHELRYNVARVLKDVEELDQLPILKI